MTTIHIPSLEPARDLMATLLAAELVGTEMAPKLCKAVYNNKPSSLAGLAPAVFVLTAGSKREKEKNTRIYFKNGFRLEISWLVPGAKAAAGRDEEGVDDLLDAIERVVAYVVAVNENTAIWDELAPEPEYTPINKLPNLGGLQYEMQTMHVTGNLRFQPPTP